MNLDKHPIRKLIKQLNNSDSRHQYQLVIHLDKNPGVSILSDRNSIASWCFEKNSKDHDKRYLECCDLLMKDLVLRGLESLQDTIKFNEKKSN